MSKKISFCSLVLASFLFAVSAGAETETVLKIYTVKKGDTFFKISENFYGSGERWKEIWDFNKYIKKSHWIFPGDELIVPLTQEKKIVQKEEEPAIEKIEEEQNFDMFIAPYKENSPQPLDFKYAGKISAFTEEIALHAQRSKVILDIGKNAGVKDKDTFDIYRASKKIYHPETKKLMGVLIRRFGRLTVSDDIQNNSCIATINYSKGSVQIGDFVRIAK
ncbi:LysM peptidoglycan-binding domain-containing protein [bacterium]|nr:LysM peptidoglycan-binding domain-containing protein [bacterium]MBU3955813.1 LysM peptidoglycan-binding domain-containing protein [bacterium]MBU4133739.1 LysM peptidoglycan-binding domain-containing protein [bacterium]